jgi:hypothetical protein
MYKEIQGGVSSDKRRKTPFQKLMTKFKKKVKEKLPKPETPRK